MKFENINLENAYRRAIINSMYGGVLSSPLPAMALYFGLVYVGFHDSPYLKEPITKWACIYLVGLSVSAMTTWRWASHQKTSDGQNVSYWERVHDLLSLMQGICFGYFYSILSIENEGIAFVYIALLTAVTIAAALTAGLRTISNVCFLSPIIFFLTTNFWGTNYFDEFLLALAAITVLSYGFTLKSRGVLLESVKLKFENEALLQKLKLEKEAAELANHTKTKFLAAASHDLRQPLQSLSLLIAALFAHIDKDKQKEILNKARQSLDSLSELLDSLLDISKLDAELVQPHYLEFNLKDLLEQELDKQAPSIKAKGLEIALNYKGPETFSSDPILLSRILSNLVSNAGRYTLDGRIDINLCASERSAKIEVKDTGIGIQHDQLDLIFNEFYQIENPERDRAKGLGLGLSIVKRLCDLLEAQISVESTPGKGSSFHLALPNSTATKPLALDKKSPQKPIDISSLNVLVIDDEIMVRESMGLLLESWDCEYSTHSDLEIALDYLQDDKRVPDALVVDYRLKDHHTGVECISAINQRLGVKVPALIITGDTAPARVKTLQKSGIPFIHKPIEARSLREFLESVKH